jgi:hypothetical protein
VYTLYLKQRDWSRILSVFHLLIALILVFDLLHLHPVDKKDWIFFFVFFMAGILLFITGLFTKKILKSLSKNLNVLLFESGVMLCAAIYFWSRGVSLVAFSHGVLAGVIVLFWIYLKRREKGEIIVVSETNITLPGLSGDRIIEWNELTNLIKKHDLLTIDFKNNKLLQVQIINDDEINENEFNRFCRDQLSKQNK